MTRDTNSLVPEGQNVVSQAVAHSAKSAIRGSRLRQIPDRVRSPWLAASNSAPRMSGRAISNSRHISPSGRRRACGTYGKFRKMARSARSDRVMMSSMPLRMAGRAA